jgi:hypothetical protein
MSLKFSNSQIPTTKKSIPAVLSAVVEMLDPLHKVKQSDFAAQIINVQINLEVGNSEHCISKTSGLAVGPNQPPIQCVQGVPS